MHLCFSSPLSCFSLLNICADDSSEKEFSKKPTKTKTPARKMKTEPVSTSIPPSSKTSASTSTQGPSTASVTSILTAPPIVKPRGRGRPRKYPLPDPSQSKPNVKKTAADVTKIVTRKQSQSSMSSRVSKLFSSINRDVTDTDSDTGKIRIE